MHIGSGPGVSGLSAMQVKPFFPGLTVRILPSACIATTVAPSETLAGAAVIALAMIPSSVAAAGLSAALAFSAKAAIEAPRMRHFAMFWLRMNYPLVRKNPRRIAPNGGFVLRSLAVTYSCMAKDHTTIGAECFHFR